MKDAIEAVHNEEGVLGEHSQYLTDVGLTGLPVDLPYEQWEWMGRQLGKLARAMQWAVGDWLLYGEHTYGEKFAQAGEISGYRPDTLVTYQNVAQRVPQEVRRAELTFAHHQVVAYLVPDERAHWLEFCINQNWSVGELRAHVKDDSEMGSRSTSKQSHYFELRLRWEGGEPDPEKDTVIAKIKKLVAGSEGIVFQEITK